jgi:ribokinase
VKPPRIAVAGNINADLSYRVARPPHPGETLLADGLTIGAGGKASNACVALTRLGASPLLIGSVGEDAFGAIALEALERAGVATDHVTRRAHSATGVATVLVQSHGENMIVTHLGANLEMDTAELPRLDGCDALLMTLGLPPPVLRRLASHARELSVRLVVDATPLRGDRLPPEVLAADVLSANRVEAEQLTGRAIDCEDEVSVQEACAALRALGAKAAVLKLGEWGAAWTDGHRHGHVRAPAVQTVDSTGAGDAFMAGLTLRLVEGTSLPAAVELACLLGALSTTGVGSQGGWSSVADLERFVATVSFSATARLSAAVSS